MLLSVYGVEEAEKLEQGRQREVVWVRTEREAGLWHLAAKEGLRYSLVVECLPSSNRPCLGSIFSNIKGEGQITKLNSQRIKM